MYCFCSIYLMSYKYNEKPCSLLQESGFKDRADSKVKRLHHSFSCLCLPRDFIFTYKYLKIKCWIPVMKVWIHILCILNCNCYYYFYSLLTLYPRSKCMQSFTGVGNVVKLIAWSFPDAGLQKHIESIGHMGCILDTAGYMCLYIYLHLLFILFVSVLFWFSLL